MKPTGGDIRCIVFGHITRMAIWNLRPTWDPAQSAEKKLAIVRANMDAIAIVDDVKAHLEGVSTAQPSMTGGLFGRQEHRNALDAVTF
jgi:hypothetical protein